MNPTDLRNLPAPVIERLAKGDTRAAGIDATRGGLLLEGRRAKLEVRSNGDGTVGLHGYATVYDYPYDVAGGPPYGWVETIARGACAKSVAERADVRCLFDHGWVPLARTKSETMTLESDDIGLMMDVPSLDLRSNHTTDVVVALERGDLDEMSFAFRVIRQEWNDDYSERLIKEVKLYDVSIVTYPANPATFVQLRDDDLPAPQPEGHTTSLALARAIQTSIAG